VKTIGLVVHPSRPIDRPLDILRTWTAEHDIDLVQLRTDDGQREVAPYGSVDRCDLVVAIGGDGTVLWALGAAEPTGTPVLGVACGSLGALTTTSADELEESLDAFAAGEWTPRVLPALSIAVDGKHVKQAINDVVLVRRTGQLQVDLSLDGELYARMAGDGVIVATALGSTAYSMAAGGPVLAQGTDAFVATPLAIHGGSIPPLVVPGDGTLQLDAHPSFDGFDIEVDGHVKPAMTAASYTIRLTEARSALVCLTDPGRGFEALRRRGIITDSPRVLARDRRTETAAGGKVSAS
jgi:NAD+ kinase